MKPPPQPLDWVVVHVVLALLLAAAAPSFVRLQLDETPHLFDDGELEPLRRNLEAQVDWYTSLEQDTRWPLGDDTVSASQLQAGCLALLVFLEPGNVGSLDRLVRDRFDLYAAVSGTDTGRVLFTGYHNPVFPASLEPDSVYRYPLYRKPDRGSRRTRKEIDQDLVLAGRGLEVAWLRDRFDRYEIHIEGSATLVLPDSSTRNVRYDGYNGYPYHSLGRALVRHGVLPPESTAMDEMRRYFQRHPEKLQRWLNHNTSYCFFKLDSRDAPGSLNLPLVPERTMAMDADIFPPGIACWIALRVPVGDSTEGIARLALNQDRGAAIKGPARADIFWGTGERPALLARTLKTHGRLLLLVPKQRP